ncbi:MAG TPA: hypothetical protein PLK35_00840 [Candidatus Moranbacteria bacterium]|nr:hypothetical protein [Candidatus Moranbacteria bacterium]
MKKLIIALSVLIVLGVLGFGAYKIFFAPKVSQEFIDSHNKIADLDSEVEKLTGSVNATDFEKLMSDKNYNGVIKAVDDTLVNENQALLNSKTISQELAKLRTMSDKISDAQAKEAALKRITLGEKDNVTKIKYIEIRIQLLGKMKEVVSHVNKDEKLITVADEKAVDALGKQIDEAISQGEALQRELDTIRTQYEAAEKEFMKVSGLSEVK